MSRSRGTITEIPFTHLSLLFARPNRYAISYEDAIPSSQGQTKYRVVSDGKRIRSSANQLPNQIHEAFAPRETTIDNLIPEPELRQAILQVALENLFPQLVMLLTRDGEKQIFPRNSEMKILPDQKIGDESYYRLALTEPEGDRVLWIDKKKFILRRMEIPIEGQRETLDPTNQFSSFSVDLDFEDVTLDPEFDEAAVSLEVPEKGRLVRRFVPPPPTGPASDLGQPVKEFVFTDANDTKVTSASLEGKIGILDFWATDCAPCKEHTPELEQAYQQLKGDENILFFGVSTDPKGLPTEDVKKTLKSWGATFPLLRDPEKYSFYSLDIKATPTLLLLGQDGRLLARRVGMLESDDELVKKVRQIQAGEDLVQQARDDYAKELEEHETVLTAATLEKSLIDEKSAAASIAPRKLPEYLQIEELWKSKLASLNSPGDIAALTSAQVENQEILVLDGGEAVVRYDRQGQQLGRVELPTHEEKKNGFVRAAIDGNGKSWFLVSGIGWQQVLLYDNDWKFVFAFPDQKHSGIGDARFLDLKSNGLPDIFVGYWGGFGVQAGNLEGQQLWVNRHLDHVLQVAGGARAKSGDGSLWCTSTRGTIFEIAPDGKSSKEIVVPGHTMVSLEPKVAGEDADRWGLSRNESSQYSVVSFDQNGKVSWVYSLPAGEYAAQIPPIQSLNLVEQVNCRVVAAPNGSLHFLSADGELIDRFDYGAVVTGLASFSSGEGAFLWVSADNRLTAWRIATESAP